MKRVLLFFVFVFGICFNAKTQTLSPPKGINYQAILRDTLTGKPIVKSNMRLKFSLRNVNGVPSVAYLEEFSNVASNRYGLINLVVGKGTNLLGSSGIDMVKWFSDQFEVGIVADTGSGVYDVDFGFTKLWSVPYSFYSHHSLFSDTAKQLKINHIPNRLLKVSMNGNSVVPSHISEDTVLGNLTFGAAANRAGIHFQNEFGQNGFVVDGSQGSGSFPSIAGPGTRLMWIPQKSAFRAGQVMSNIWDAGSVGDYSFAFGLEPEASGMYSLSMGIGTKATGAGAVAIGGLVESTDSGAVGLGLYVAAKGKGSFVIGRGASQLSKLKNTSPNSLVIGFNSSKPTLYVGSSLADGYWGKVGIGTKTPIGQLHVVDTGNVSPTLYLESYNNSFAEALLKSSSISSGVKIRYTYWDRNSERAATTFYRTNATFRISTETIDRVQIGADPSNTLMPYVGIGGGILQADSNVRLAVEEGHLQSIQTNSPHRDIISPTPGFTVTLTSINPVSTDVSGQIVVQTSDTLSITATQKFLFERPYAHTPVIVISPVDGPSVREQSRQSIFVTADNRSFSVFITNPDALNPGTFRFNYFIIETKR